MLIEIGSIWDYRVFWIGVFLEILPIQITIIINTIDQQLSMKKIILIGATPYADNRGVSAMTAATIKIIQSKFSDAEIVIWHTFPETYLRQFPTTDTKKVKIISDGNAKKYLIKLPLRICLFSIWRALSKIKINPKFKMIDNVTHDCFDADVIINLNFGDVFTDNYGALRSFACFSQNLLTVITGKKVILFPQTIGTFNTIVTMKLAKFILNKTSKIVAREKTTLNYLKSIGVDEKKIYLIPDTAYLLDPADDKQIDKILKLEGASTTAINNRPIIGISVSPQMAKYSKIPGKQEIYVETMRKLVEYFVTDIKATVIFVPHVTSIKGTDTKDLAQSIVDRLNVNERSHVITITGEYTAEELKGIIGRCELFVASLTHTFVAATSLSIPTVAIAYGSKTKAMMDLVGLKEYVIDFKDLDYDYLLQMVKEVWENKQFIKNDLKLKMSVHKEWVMESRYLID